MSIECQVIFKVHAFTQPNETVKIVGNTTELGLWNIDYAFVLSTDITRYPEWINEKALLVPKGTKLEFKLVIVKGTSVQWETLPQNRKYRARYCRVVLKAQWNNCEGRVIVEKKFKSSLQLNPATLQNFKKQRSTSKFDPYDQNSSDSDDQMDSFSMNDIPHLPHYDDKEDNFSVGDTPQSKSKKIHHNVENSIIEEEDTDENQFKENKIKKRLIKISDPDVQINSLEKLYTEQSRRIKIDHQQKSRLTKNDQLYPTNQSQQKLQKSDVVLICTLYLPIQLTFMNQRFSHQIDVDSISYKIAEACSKIQITTILIGIPKIFDHLNNPITLVLEEEQKQCKDYLNQQLNWEPIFFPDLELEIFTSSFFQQFYEPIMSSRPTTSELLEQEYIDFIKISQSFLSQLTIVIDQLSIEKTCMTLVVDDRLIMLPIYLTRDHQISPISLFLYKKFPNKDSLKALPFSAELINSMLLCNQILFPNYDTASNFFDLLTASENLNLRSQKGSLIVKYLGRDLQIKIKNTGLFQGNDNQTISWLEESLMELKQNHANMNNSQIILSDIQGLIQKQALNKNYSLLNVPQVVKSFSNIYNKVLVITFSSLVKSKKIETEMDADKYTNHITYEIDPRIIYSLNQLSQKYSLFIISQGSHKQLELSLQKCQGLNLFAENGYYYKTADMNRWGTLFKFNSQNLTMPFKLMQAFVSKVEGGKLKVLDTILRWEYSLEMQECGRKIATELTNSLKAIIENYPNMEVVQFSNKVEVKTNIDKGTILETLLQRQFIKSGKIEGIICIGNAIKDEDLFRSLNICQTHHNAYFIKDALFYSISRQISVTYATHYLESDQEFIDLMQLL